MVLRHGIKVCQSGRRHSVLSIDEFSTRHLLPDAKSEAKDKKRVMAMSNKVQGSLYYVPLPVG